MFHFKLHKPDHQNRVVANFVRVLPCVLLLAFRTSARAASGDVDLSFDPGSGPNADVYCVATLPDGKALIGGAFTSVNGTNRNHIARLNSDGSLDPTFDPGQGANDIVIALAPLDSGEVLIAGAFTSVNGTGRSRLARLHANGSVDDTFESGATIANDVYALAVQPDGKSLVAGRFPAILRFNTDGTLDQSFNSGGGANGVVNALGLQPDGKVIAGGAFSIFDKQPRNRLARLNSDGSLDGTFFPGTGPNSDVDCIAVQPDGKAVIGGAFTLYDGRSRNHIARLTTDGSPDGTFYALGGADGAVLTLALQTDAKVLIAGNFTAYAATPRGRVARLKPDGSLDTTFDPGAGADASVRSIASSPDDKVLIGGSFTMVNGISRPHVARLSGDPYLSIAAEGSNITLSWSTNWSGYTLQSATTLTPPVAWTDWTNGIAINGANYTLTNPTTGTARFYRLKK